MLKGRAEASGLLCLLHLLARCVLLLFSTSGTVGTSIGPKALAQAFNEHARLGSTSEEVSGEHITAALHDKALKLQPVREAAHAKCEQKNTAGQTPSLPETNCICRPLALSLSLSRLSF